MPKTSLLLALFLALLARVYAQDFGNGWIDYRQTYYKVKVAQDNFYRIAATDLDAVGFPRTIPSNRVQLFRRGVEVSIHVETNNNGRIEFIEFYGQRNDGTGDIRLYDNPDHLPHLFYNLFTDSAAYFLTYKLSGSTAKRIRFISDLDTDGLTPESFHLEDTLILYTDNYNSGNQFGDGNSLSTYVQGEGWTGFFRNRGQSTSISLSLKNLAINEADILLDLVLTGGNNLSHNARISAGPSTSNLTVLDNILFESREAVRATFELSENFTDPAGNLTVQVFAEGIDGESERLAVSYFRIVYPQEIPAGLGGNRELNFSQPLRKWVKISDSQNLNVYDITDPDNLSRVAVSNQGDFIIPQGGTKVLLVRKSASVGSISSGFQIPEYNLSNKNYLLISHQNLRTGATDAIQDYADYRSSVSGGEYRVQVANIDDLYNLYSFGDPSPLAIVDFIREANSISSLEHLFIIGKGYANSFDADPNLDGTDFKSPARVPNLGVYIPTYGFPGGDLMFTRGLTGDINEPELPVGRLSARSAEDVSAYLDKIVEMEALPFDDLFRKDFLQLSGGIANGESALFASYILAFEEVLENDFLGGRAFNTSKQTINPIEFIDVTDRVNEGVGFITFFGHSSGSSTDIDIGRVSDPRYGYANKGKYPIMLVNGCKAGEIFDAATTFGEDWVLTPDLGSIGFIAHTSNAFSTKLKMWSDIYFETGFAGEFIQRSLGEVYLETAKKYKERYGTNNLDLSMIQQIQLQGDPAVRIFGADFPDYQTDSQGLIASPVEGSVILATQDSFKVDLIVKNFGRSVLDSLEIAISRRLPDGREATFIKKYERVLRQDTLPFFVPLNPSRENSGANRITVTLDPNNLIEELNESNNTSAFDVFIFGGSTIHLFPVNNQIVDSLEIDLIWQASNVVSGERVFDLEIDIQSNFSSASKVSFSVTGNVGVIKPVDLSTIDLTDSTVFYWRTRLADAREGESDDWVNSTFTYLVDESPGWIQADQALLENQNAITGIELDQGGSNWVFKQSNTPITFFTFGVDSNLDFEVDTKAESDGVNLFFVNNSEERASCKEDRLDAVVFNKESGNPYKPLDYAGQGVVDVNNGRVCGGTSVGVNGQPIYQMTLGRLINDDDCTTDLTPRSINCPPGTQLEQLVNAMQDGDKIAFFTVGFMAFSQWNARVTDQLNRLGVNTSTITGLVDGQAIIIFGEKGAAPGTATLRVTTQPGIPITEADQELTANVRASFTSGSIRTPSIGPAKDWIEIISDVTLGLNDSFTITLSGITNEGVEEKIRVFDNGRFSLGSVDPEVYPQTRLLFEFADEVDFTPPQLNGWKVGYELPPELILLPLSREQQTLQQGQPITREYFVYNYAQVDFSDSISISASLVNTSNALFQNVSFNIAPPRAQDTVRFNVTFSGINLQGKNSLIVEALANETELTTLNNRIALNDIITVETDDTNPVLDVTFDGYHILNGDIVSPSPLISILLRDENKFLFKDDTIGFQVALKSPNSGDFQRVNFTDPKINYTPATENADFEIEYRPGPLEDGIYSLQVDGLDASNNAPGAPSNGTDRSTPYEIDFEVINESSITHFYPYPNPFSTSCRFVFTLTGSEIPDEIKIQIMTISGRVVREILQDEIGSLRIGNNITEYAWNGTDEFGDQLANGVYFYKVFVKSGGSTVQNRATYADRAFKNGVGKLYILR